MECEIKWQPDDGISFEAKTGSGHSITLDTAIGDGVLSRGPRPMETLLVGAVACTQYDLIVGIKKAGGTLYSCKAVASGVRREISPKIFTQIRVHFFIESLNISQKTVRQILENSREINGSAMKMLEESAEIIFEFDLLTRTE